MPAFDVQFKSCLLPRLARSLPIQLITPECFHLAALHSNQLYEIRLTTCAILMRGCSGLSYWRWGNSMRRQETFRYSIGSIRCLFPHWERKLPMPVNSSTH